MKNSFETLAETSPQIAFRTFRETAVRIAQLESELGESPGAQIWNIRRANQRIAALEAIRASRAKAAVAAPVAPIAAAPTAPVVEKFGRERFNASCAADAAAKPKSQNHPELSRRERFCADVRLDAMPQNLSAAGTPENAGAKSEKTGRARFAAALKKSN